MLGGIGPMELIIIFLIVILLFGGKKIPEIAKGLGKGIKDFKTSLSGADAEDEAKSAKIENKPGAPTGGAPQGGGNHPKS